MIIVCENGLQYAVDVEARRLEAVKGAPLYFDRVAAAYAGSKGVTFYGPDREVLFETGPVAEVYGLLPVCMPTEFTLFCTQNSTYEIDTNAKRIRRLYGLNAPRSYQSSDGDWQTYEWVLGVREECRALIHFAEGKAITTSRIRWIDGEVPDSPTGELFGGSVPTVVEVRRADQEGP